MQTIYFGKNRYPPPCLDCVVLNHVSSKSWLVLQNASRQKSYGCLLKQGRQADDLYQGIHGRCDQPTLNRGAHLHHAFPTAVTPATRQQRGKSVQHKSFHPADLHE